MNLTPVNLTFIPRYDLAPHWFEIIFHLEPVNGKPHTLLFGAGTEIEMLDTVFKVIEEPALGTNNLFKIVRSTNPGFQKRLQLAIDAGIA